MLKQLGLSGTSAGGSGWRVNRVNKERGSPAGPGSKPGLRVLAGTIIEGLEDLAEIADGVA
jgi:hypothetical protein